MLELVLGSRTKTPVDDLITELRSTVKEGTLYIGYPVLATVDDTITLDALLTAPDLGVVAFDIAGPITEPFDLVSYTQVVVERQDRLIIGLKSKLIKHRALTRRGELVVSVTAVTYLPSPIDLSTEEMSGKVAARGKLQSALAYREPLASDIYRALNAAIQHVSTIKPRNQRLNVTRVDSRGGIMRVIEKEIANLDPWQKRGAIETPEGPQRIRGLAGSGKTVVLALKAAYLQAQHPSWRIAVTFNTRSLLGQFKDFIRRFSFEYKNDEPNWENLQVLPSWGSANEQGLYSQIATANGQPIRDFGYAKNEFGRSAAFEGVCDALLRAMPPDAPELYDAILLDEAQDFPRSFFRLAYRALRPPKRLVWAYDELQTLNDVSLPPIDDLFGKDESGTPLVSLKNSDGQAHEDVILKTCYRNTPWALSTAHAIGFGIYRSAGFIQAFEDPSLWTDIGYSVSAGTLTDGSTVTLERDRNMSPHFFEELVTPKDAVVFREFGDDAEQLHAAADAIEANVHSDELDASDIVVIFPNPISSSQRAGPLVAELRHRGIAAHVAGVTRSRDEFFVRGSVVVSGIFRAKGNEAAMVYLLDSQYCLEEPESIRKRNTLFTALTRSRAWVRAFGVGSGMSRLKAEYDEVVRRSYRLTFQLPTAEERARLRRIHRDRSPEERKRLEAGLTVLGDFLERIELGEISLEEVPSEMRSRIRSLLSGAQK